MIPNSNLLERGVLAIFFGAFVTFGLLGVRNVPFHPHVTQPGAFSSMDSDLAIALGVERGSARVLTSLKSLEADRPLIVFYSGEPSAKVAQIISVLAWPRPAWLMELPLENADEVLAEALARNPKGIFFAGVLTVPGLGNETGIGHGLTLVTREELAQ
jgi:hypothetical protein